MPARVLVAGLDSRSLLLEAPMLRRDGHTIAEAASGRALLEMLEEPGSRLIVLGPSLPDLAVPDLIRRIRGNRQTRTISILTLVPLAEPSAFDLEASQAGSNAVLRRPLDRVVLEGWASKLLSVPRRVETRAAVSGQLVGTPKSGAGHFCGLTVNISTNGMLLASPVHLGAGPDLDLEFTLPEPSRRLNALGRVVREAPEVSWPYIGYGVEFLFVPPGTQEAIAELLTGTIVEEASAPDRTFGIHSTLRREEWIYDILAPVRDDNGWHVEIRRSARGSWRPGMGGPFYVVEGLTPGEAVDLARAFVVRNG